MIATKDTMKHQELFCVGNGRDRSQSEYTRRVPSCAFVSFVAKTKGRVI